MALIIAKLLLEKSKSGFVVMKSKLFFRTYLVLHTQTNNKHGFLMQETNKQQNRAYSEYCNNTVHRNINLHILDIQIEKVEYT